MPRTNLKAMKKIWAEELVKKTNYSLDGPAGKAMVKDLMKLNMFTLAVISGRKKP